MPINTENLEPHQIGLIGQSEDGSIYQIGLTPEQSKMINMIVSAMSKEQPLLKTGPEHDLVLKRNLCNKCQKK